MLAGSNTKKREDTTSPEIQAKLNGYLAEQNLHAPVERVFKQVERKQGQAYYYRSLFGGLAGVAFLALLGSGASFYIGYTLLASVLLCSTIGLSAVNFWLAKAIPEVKISTSSAEKPSCKTPLKSDVCLQQRNILFRGVSYSIKHESAIVVPTTPKPSSDKKPTK